MPTLERRKGRRESKLPPGTSFVEIEHSYGPRKTSVYQLVEQDEHGLSFLIPDEEGYFLPGTPLRFFVILQDKFKTQHVGIARHHYPVYTDDGGRYRKLGVELRSSLRNPPRVKYVLRPPRLTTSRGRRFCIDFTHAGQPYHFELIDFSRYSAAFCCDPEDLLALQISSVLSEVRIRLGNKAIFEGEATITSAYTDRNDRHRVIIEPKHSPIEVEQINKVELVSTAFEETNRLIRRHAKFQHINTTFKAMVADMRFFLEDFKDYLESPLFKSERRDPEMLLEEIFPPFFDKLDGKITRLDTFTEKLDLEKEEKNLYKQYCQKNLLSLFIAAPNNHRIYFKPKGYPGDFEMIRMFNSSRFEGETLFGKIMNKYSTMIPISRAVQQRTIHFKDLIRTELQKNRSLKIFSVASGPALEFELLLKEDPGIIDSADITLLDQEVEALQFSMDNLFEERIRAGSGVKINFIHQSLGNYLKSVARGRTTGVYDLIYASGLFDYFDDKASVFAISRLLKLLRKGGKLIIANLSLKGHEHRAIMEFCLEWHLIYRSREEMARLASAVPGTMKTRVKELGNGMLMLLEVEN